MKKRLTRTFICQSCGQDFSRWAGKCESCGNWNSIIEEIGGERFASSGGNSRKNKSYQEPIPLDRIEEESLERMGTGLKELDLVLGGGLVPGSLTLIGGEPGVGKSTLVLEVSRYLTQANKKVLYISGEESPSQIRMRAERMGFCSSNLLLTSETYAENISAMIEGERPAVVFVDSIQTIAREALPNQAGTVTQLRECTQVLLETAKRSGIPILMTGHITKEGTIAGPKILEHLVDTVLYFEGDRLNYYRLLRAVKNRFGAVGDLAIFEMFSGGLREVGDRNSIFISAGAEERSGSVISAVLEGSRALTVEVQALVSKTGFAQARRMAEGPDTRRVILLAAVIEKYIKIKLGECDLFSNLAGGLNADEPALDLAICTSIISSYLDQPLPKGTCILGEVGLSGEVRSIGQANLRIKELAGVGMKKVILPEGNLSELVQNTDIQIQGIRSLNDLRLLFPGVN
ncbi:DNA repair protein RadA [Leptospira mayottensis]|uniref:DNA repair protein RadA n=2 Tax=Leptospira mayottensis TaxID=1137606 RepID=A0AA87MNF7_9LEPT|nr:DNA repair protein RadA [Leptospira mayottensis]AXR62121.1 DNA repair protein RadA [Leptospira mayottensis]AXR62997.1 DNA repair protein RadA [Leptospira mayottensis]AZQ01430.1 DNA repair protein RadA [Leptospira mayottensis 200901116]EKS00699.1 DNA repair protein RadA [Leptospira mayottensis 200901122]TGM99783.1 DNA repair protein RadA [Leptospira mayottensis]